VSEFPAGLGPRIAVAVAGVLAWFSLAAAPVDVLRDCAAKASPAISGIKDLGPACPDLAQALEALGLTPMFSDGWQEQINTDALRDLANLAEGYHESRPRVSPDVAALPGILKALEREQTPLSKSWWDGFKAWLAHHWNVLSWLERWLARVGQSTTLFNLVSYSLVALVLMAAVAVLANELKVGGAGWRRRRAQADALDPAAAGVDSAASRPGAPADGLAELLRALVSRLIQTRRLETERSLTHRELVTRSTFDSESQLAAFAAVAGTAESILYGAYSAAPDELRKVLLGGRALLAQLSDTSSAH
jgi:hypothetical protein